MAESKSVEWSENLIDTFKESWKYYYWNLLLSNEAIPWDNTMIQKYEKHLNFKVMSWQTNLKWNEEIIEKYSDRFDWSKLSKNTEIVWSENMIDKFKDLIDWVEISGNPNLPWSSELIRRYQNKLIWQNKETHIYYKYRKRCISNNKGIVWDINSVKEFSDKIDFWTFSIEGNISEDIIMAFATEFDRAEVFEPNGIRLSGGRDPDFEDDIRTGWDNLRLNPNTKFTIKSIAMLYLKTIPSKFKYGSIENNDCLLSLYSTWHFENLTFEEIVNNELGFGKYFVNENVINESIWTNYVKPLFDEKFVLEYLNNLRLKISAIN